MMKSVRAGIALLIFIVLPLFCGCGANNGQPTSNELEEYLCENIDDFNSIIDYVVDQNGRVHITYNGTEFENWFDTELPKDIKQTIKKLKRHNRIIILKSGNTVLIELWHPFMREKSSGLAYSINGIDIPVVEYAVEMVPLSIAGWYYYVDDFNTWRVEQTRDTSNALEDTMPANPSTKGQGDGSLVPSGEDSQS